MNAFLARGEIIFVAGLLHLSWWSGWAGAAEPGEPFHLLSTQFLRDVAPPDASGGLVFVYLRSGSTPLTSESLRLNGEPLPAWHERRVLAWWRLRPEPLPPNASGELALRFQRLPADANLQLEWAGKTFTVALSPSPLQIVTVANEADLRGLTVLVRRGEGASDRLTEVRIDGEGVETGCRFTIPVFFHDLAALSIRLPAPWEPGSYHVLEVVGGRGERAATQVRAWAPGFEVGTFGTWKFADYQAHGLDTYQSFGWLPPEVLDRAQAEGLRVTMPFFLARRAYFYDGLPLEEVEERFRRTGGHPALLAHYLEDEPDVFDWFYPATFRQELTFRFPQEVTLHRAVFEGLDARGLRCTLEVLGEEQWKPVAEHDAWETLPDRKNPQPLSLEFDPVGTTALRLVIERCRVIPVVAEAHFYAPEGRDWASQAQAEATTRMDRWYGRRDRGPEKMVDGDPKTSWRAGHSYRDWVGNMALEMVQREILGKRLAPRVASMLLVDNTYRPGNFFTYGHIADVFDHDIYLRPAPGQAMDWEEVARRTELVRRACEPKPLWITLWLGWGANYCRALTAAEERIMAFYALGAGAKGINYFLHSGGIYSIVTGMVKTGRKAEGEALWEGVGQLNRQLRWAGPWLVRAYPVAAEVEATEGLWVRTLLSGPEGLVVILVNQQARGTGKGYQPAPLRNVRLRVEQLPWLEEVRVRRVTPGGFETLPVRTEGHRWEVRLPEVEEGEILIFSGALGAQPSP